LTYGILTVGAIIGVSNRGAFNRGWGHLTWFVTLRCQIDV